MSDTIDVDLWVWSLEVDGRELQQLATILSDDEKTRAGRFVYDRDRRRFVVARGTLRKLLAPLFGVPPAAIVFAYAAQGKPSVPAAPSLHFNLSHSENLAALAVSRQREIGVDIEHVRALKEDVAERFFSAREVTALRAMPADRQLEAFYRCWTRKEAIVKAIGEGLSHALDSFDVTLGADAPAAVERFAGEADASRVWRLAHFDPAPGYMGAVACRTGGAALSVRRFAV